LSTTPEVAPPLLPTAAAAAAVVLFLISTTGAFHSQSLQDNSFLLFYFNFLFLLS
jgi:hypothetical protein